MTKQVWLNLPVKSVQQSKAFFAALGWKFNEAHSSEVNAALVVGEKAFVVMLFEEKMFENITRNKATDTSQSTEVMISFDAESREEIDEIAEKVNAAGGNVFAGPGESQGWMYACAFTDPDGHRWNALYMDASKMPQH
jgi:predicted lactoylglutathione lyase